VPRLFVAILFGCLAAVLAFSQAAASVGLQLDMFRPLGAGFFSMRTVETNTALRVVGEGAPVDSRQSAKIGREGLVYAPLNTRALWLVGKSFEDQKQTDKARAAMLQAERATRRDPAVELWLGLDRIKRGEVALGLRNFDLLIRTNAEAAKLITPALAKVLADPQARQQLTPYFAATNPWLVNLVWASTYSVPSVKPLASLLIGRPGKAPDVAGIRPIYGDLVKKLLKEGAYDQALQLYPKLPGTDPASLRSLDPAANGKIIEGYAPFVWEFGDGDSQGGDLVRVDAKRTGLDLDGAPGTVGTAASKLVTPAGRSVFSWQVVDRSANLQGSAQWIATCLLGPASGAKTQSVDLLDKARPIGRTMAMALPTGCDLMRIDLEISGGIGRTPANLIVADLELSAPRP
jgi:hypothetical protein